MATHTKSRPKRPARRARRTRSEVDEIWSSISHTVPTWARLRNRVSRASTFPSVQLWLVRHGETTTNARGLITGVADAPLTKQGQQQACAAARELSDQKFDAACSSTLRRSEETLATMLGAGHIHVEAVWRDERLNERSLGDMELTPSRHIEAFAHGDLSYAPPGGESYSSVARRCLAYLTDVARLAIAVERPLTLLVCTHVGPMRILAGMLREMEDPVQVLALHYGNSEPVCFEFDSLRWPAFLD